MPDSLVAGASVGAIYLVHGTFVGNDALGLINRVAGFFPTAGLVLRDVQKQLVDALRKMERDAPSTRPAQRDGRNRSRPER